MAPKISLEDHARKIKTLQDLIDDETLPEDSRAVYQKELDRQKASLAATLKDPTMGAAEAAPAETGASNPFGDFKPAATGGLDPFADFKQADPFADFKTPPPQAAPAPKPAGTIDPMAGTRFQGLLPKQTPEEFAQHRQAAKESVEGLVSSQTYGLTEPFFPKAETAEGGLAREVGGLYGSLKLIGKAAEMIRGGIGAVGSVLKGTRLGAPLLRLAGEIVEGTQSPRLAAATQLGLGSGAAEAIRLTISPDQNLFSKEGAEEVGLSTVTGGLLGGVGTRTATQLQKGLAPQGPIRQGLNAVGIGLPIVLATGRSSTPFKVTGVPILDQSIFDFGFQALLTPRSSMIGQRLPVVAFKNGKTFQMQGEVLATGKTPAGHPRLTMRLDNGQIRDYSPGVPLDISVPTTKYVGQATNESGRAVQIKEGDIAVLSTKGKPDQLVRFAGQTGNYYRLGLITERGREPQVHTTLDAKSAPKRLRILEPAALDALFPRPLPQAGPPPIVEPETAGIGSFGPLDLPSESKTHSSGVQIYGDHPEDIRLGSVALDRIFSHLPEELRQGVKSIRVVFGGAGTPAGEFNRRTGEIFLNSNIMRARHRLETGEVQQLSDAMSTTLTHELTHNFNRPTDRYYKAVRAMGWAPLNEAPPHVRFDWPPEERNNVGRLISSDGSKLPIVMTTEDVGNSGFWFRPVSADERRFGVDGRRKNPNEDVAHAMDEFFTNPDALFAREPHRWQAVHDMFSGTPYSIPQLTQETGGQLGLFPRQITPPSAEQIPQIQQRIAGEHRFRRAAIAGKGEFKEADAGNYAAAHDEFLKTIEEYAAENPDGYEKLSKLATKQIERYTKAIPQVNIEETIPGTDTRIGDFLHDLGVHVGIGTGKPEGPKGVGAAIHNAMIDMQRLGIGSGGLVSEAEIPGKKGAPAAGLEGVSTKEAAAALGQGATGPEKSAIVRRSKRRLDDLFGHLIGTDAGKPQLKAEMARMRPEEKTIIQKYFGIDGNGNLVGDRKPFGQVAAETGRSSPELGKFFAGWSRTKDGVLHTAGELRTLRNLPVDRLGQGILSEVAGPAKDIEGAKTDIVARREPAPGRPVITGAQLGRLINVPEKTAPNYADILAEDYERASNALALNPHSKEAQTRHNAALSRLSAYHATQPQPTVESAAQASLSFVEAPTPQTPVSAQPRWIKQIRSDNLVIRYNEAGKRVITATDPAVRNRYIELQSQLAAEMNGRGIPLDSPSYPGTKEQQTAPPRQAHPSEQQPIPPPTYPPGSIDVEIIPEQNRQALEAAVKHGDLNPIRYRLTNRDTGEVYGTFSSLSLRRDIPDNPRFAVVPVGRVNVNGNQDLTEPLRYRVVDLGDGNKELGVFTASGVKQLVGSDYRAHNYNPSNQTALPSAADVADWSSRSRPLESRIGAPDLRPDEWANMPGIMKMAHTTHMVLNAGNSDAAWDVFKKLTPQIQQYDGSVKDTEALTALIHNKYGPPLERNKYDSEVLTAVHNAAEFRRKFMSEALSDYHDWLPRAADGSGHAFEKPTDPTVYKKLLEELYFSHEPPADPRLYEDGRLSVWGKLTPVVRQMVLFGHPIMRDAYLKARLSDVHSNVVIRSLTDRYERIVDGLTPMEKIAVALQAEGRYEARKSVDVSYRALVLNDPSVKMRGVKAALNNVATAFRGHGATREMVLPDMTDELRARSGALRALYDHMAQIGGLKPGDYIANYMPHLYRTAPGGAHLELPTDMNPGREVYFRFFQPRTSNAPDYELNPDETTDLYIRGLARKVSYDPLLREFRDPKVQAILPSGQREYLNKWLRFLVGEPEQADSLLSKYFRELSNTTPPTSTMRWLRRLALSASESRPFTVVSRTVRAAQFMAKIEFNLITSATNASQPIITQVMRMGFTPWLKAVKASMTDVEIKRLFQESGLGTEYGRADLGAEIKAQKTYFQKIRAFGAASFTRIEAGNKAQSFASAFRLAKENGFDTSDAFISGILESDLTQFNMTRSGRLPLVRGGWGSTLFQFMPYRIEMLRLMGSELYNYAKGARIGGDAGKQMRDVSAKRMFRAVAVLHLLGGMDAHFGPLLRMISGDDDAEYSNKTLAALDHFSLDWAAGQLTQGKPFEWGHRINPINVFNGRLVGPALGALTDLVTSATGGSAGPKQTIAQQIQRNLPLPGAVQAERTAGDLLEPFYRLFLSRKQAKLRYGRTIPERLFGPTPKKGSPLNRG